MAEAEIQISNALGLHARPAARFVDLASRFRSRITVSKGGSRVNGKSILGLLTLAAGKGTRLRLEAEGDDAEQALRELVALVHKGFEKED